MDLTTFFGEARSLLAIQRAPHFERLCLMIEAWPNAQERDEVLVPYLMGELRRWPAYMLHIPARWLPLCVSSSPPAYVSLGQCLYMDDSSPVGLLEALIQAPMRTTWRGIYFRGLGVSAQTLERLMQDAPIEMLELDDACSSQEALDVVERLAARGQLKELFLTGLGMGRYELLTLAHLKGLNTLETLELSALALEAEDIEVLAQAEALSQLKSLYLRRTGVDASAVEVVAAGRWRALERLDMSRGRLRGARWEALASLPKLDALTLDGCGLTAQDLEVMARAGLSAKLKRLSVESNGFADPGALMWSSLEGGRMEDLHLGGNCFGLKTMQAIPWRRLEQLMELRLGDVGLDGPSLRVMIEAVSRERLESLILWGNQGNKAFARALWSKPWPALKILNLNRVKLGPYFGAITREHGQAPSLKTLRLYKGELGDEGVAQLAKWEGAPQLKTLSLAGNQIGDAGLKALAQGPLLRSVTYLELVENSFGDAGFGALVKSRQLRELKHLIVWGMSLGARAINALVKSPLSERLEELDLNDCRLHDDAVSSLAHGSFARLERLDLRCSVISEQRAHQLGRAHLPALKELMLTECRLNASAFSAWLDAGASQWQELCSLGLGGNPLTDASLERLESVSWPQLHKLLLWEVGMTPEGARSLARWPGLGRVAELNLNRNQLGALGLERLLHAQPLERLRTLKLCSNRIGDAGLKIIDDLGPGRFSALNLSDNEFDERALSQFLSSDHLSSLNKLWCGWQRWNVRALRALTESASMSSLEELHIASSWLDDEALERLAGSEALARLKTLDLSTNQITTTGIRALVQSKSLTRLECLRLSSNRLDDEAISLLLAWPGIVSLKELKLDRNPISAQAMAQLESAEHLRASLRESLGQSGA